MSKELEFIIGYVCRLSFSCPVAAMFHYCARRRCEAWQSELVTSDVICIIYLLESRVVRMRKFHLNLIDIVLIFILVLRLLHQNLLHFQHIRTFWIYNGYKPPALMKGLITNRASWSTVMIKH